MNDFSEPLTLEEKMLEVAKIVETEDAKLVISVIMSNAWQAMCTSLKNPNDALCDVLDWNMDRLIAAKADVEHGIRVWNELYFSSAVGEQN